MTYRGVSCGEATKKTTVCFAEIAVWCYRTTPHTHEARGITASESGVWGTAYPRKFFLCGVFCGFAAKDTTQSMSGSPLREAKNW